MPVNMSGHRRSVAVQVGFKQGVRTDLAKARTVQHATPEIVDVSGGLEPTAHGPGRDEDGQAVDGVGGQEGTGERWAGLEQHGRETKVAQEVQCRIDVNASGGGWARR